MPNTPAPSGVYTLLTKYEWLQAAHGDDKARVIMDVVQYEGVNPPDWTSLERGNREVCTDEWWHRLECWRGQQEHQSSRKSAYAFSDTLNCWELNYSKQSAANRWMIYQLHSTTPLDPSSCPGVENKLKHIEV